MLILYAVTISIIMGYVKGGKITGLLQKPFKLNVLVFTAIIIQLMIFTKNPFSDNLTNDIVVASHLFSYILVISFIITNIKIKGIGIIGGGILLNSLAIFLNKGYMPASVENFKGIQQSGETLNNTVMTGNETLVPWLGDIFHTPSWLPFSNAFSIGDVMIAIGVFLYLTIYMKPEQKYV